MKFLNRRLELALVAIFFLTLLYSIWAAIPGWEGPLSIQYDFVQSKAALATFYIAKGGPIFRYELPVSGPPWSVPYEFPFYQVTAAWIHNLTGLPLESAGRAAAKIFYYLSCLPLALIARELGFRGKAFFIPVVLYLTSPLYLFWSGQFMIETTAVFFGLSYLAAVISWANRPGLGLLLPATILGAMAAVAKSTTYASFALAAGIYLCFDLVKNRKFSAGQLLPALALLLVPLLAGIGWVRFTDSVKELNPLAANFHTSAALSKWYLYSDWSERFGRALWNHFFRVTIHDSIGHRAVWIFSIVLALFLGRKAWLYWLCSALFLVAPLLFTHAHLLHDYYANANAIFLVFAVAALTLAAITSTNKWARIAGVFLFIATLAYEVREFMGRGYVQQTIVRTASVDFGKKLRDLVDPEDVLLFYGEDWAPLIPFYAERRAIMMWNDNYYNSKLAQSLELLRAEGRKVGAVILCHDARTDQKLLSTLTLGPLLLKDACEVYAYREPTGNP